MHQYYVNVIKEERWFGSKIFKYKYLKDSTIGLNGMRIDKDQGLQVENMGWHLTFLGGTEKIKDKIRAYGHQEFNNSQVLDNIEINVKNNADIFFRGHVYNDIDMNVFPDDFVKQLEKYPEFIKLKEVK